MSTPAYDPQLLDDLARVYMQAALDALLAAEAAITTTTTQEDDDE
jgi:hypothetical protein